MNYTIAAVAAAIAIPGATASGAIFFTFQDPGPAKEITVEENADESMSFIYDFGQMVSLSITSDAGEVPDTVFDQTRLTLDMATTSSPIVDEPDLFVARLSGQFTFEDVSGAEPVAIFTGAFDRAVATLLMGQFMGTIEASGSVAGDSTAGSVSLEAGEALQALLEPGQELGGRQTSSFAISNLSGDTGQNGLLSLLGDAAFTGSSEVVPAPGAATALFGLGGFALRRRR